jgi:DNA-binding NtrC family response regulator
MKILFSWIALNEDMKEIEKTGEYDGPTIQAIKQGQYDVFFLFASDRTAQNKASQLKRYMEANKNIFQVKKIELVFINIINPTDYSELWDKIPKKAEALISNHKNEDPEIYINLSAGTPAMRTTWMMMVGSGQIKASVLNVQRKKDSEETTIEKVDVGIYPFVSEIKQAVDKQLKIPQTFKSPKMQTLMRKLALITGDINMPILLLGETGVGKTEIAKAYHLMTNAPVDKFFPFVCGEFNVGDLNTIKSQLFGHTRGAFTGADQETDGILLKADGGVVFLDEIGDISVEVQRLLINAVEKKEFRRFGGSEMIRSDFRLICATNRDINEMLKNNELSQDFYNRIRSCEYTIPPLRERKEDIPIIVGGLLATDSNYKKLSFTEDVLDELIAKLKQLSLPGNIRDIQRMLDHLTIQANQPKVHELTIDEIKAYFEKIAEPTQTDEFVTLIHQLVKIWPHTVYADNKRKLSDVFTETALLKLSSDPYFKKKSGVLNIDRISKRLGIDGKTIKSKLNIN